ncbi:MAG: T9SS type A sorting domain-containing protein [Bacteroidota bacterium]
MQLLITIKKQVRPLLSAVLCMLSLAVASASPSTVDCQALFDYKVYEGPLPTIGGITFTNLSNGSFENVSWDFGDNQFSSDESETVDHFYSTSGEYTVCLNIWDDQDCSSQYCSEIQVNIGNLTCNQTDCVYPGDVNLDGQADLYDLLSLGIGYGIMGPERMNATTNWEPQMAEDWDHETPDGINYKHLDCNGDGIINSEDLLAIVGNYSAMYSLITQEESDGPNVFLEFDADTIYINETTPEWITVTASLNVGSNQYPFKDFYGMALYLDYDTTYVNPVAGVSIDYNENSFIGDLGAVLPYGLDMREEGQIDLGFTRTDNVEVGGYGRVARVEYIISSDIIDGRTIVDDVAHFAVPINGVQVVNSEGEEKYVSLDIKPATVVFVNAFGPTNTEELTLAESIEIYPNPANQQLNVYTSDIQVDHFELYNILGEQVLNAAAQGQNHILELGQLDAGLYMLQVHTQDGLILPKRLMIQR